MAGNDEGGEKYMKNISSVRNHVLRGHANKFTSFLSFLELWKTSHPDNAYETSIDGGSINQRKDDKVSVSGRFSYYIFPCHPYGDKHPNQREFEVNIIALMAHSFTSLFLMDRDCFRKLTQYLDLRLHPVE